MANKIFIIWMIIILFIVSLVGCVEESEKDPLGGLGYIDAEFGFGYNPPSGWYSEDIGTIKRFSPFDFNYSSWNDIIFIIAPGFVVDLENTLNKTFTTQGLIDYYIDLDKDDRINITSIEEISFKNLNCIEIFMSANATKTETSGLDSIQVNYIMLIKTLTIIKDEKFFQVQYNAPEDLYDTYIDVVNESINSLVIV